MIYSLKKQQGLSILGITLLLSLIGSTVLLAFTIVPIYTNHAKVKSAMESITNIPNIELKSKAQIKTLLHKRFSINSVYNLPKDAIKIRKRGNYIKIVAKYNIKKPLVFNLNVLVEFNDFVQMGRK
jgi:hypothetical protein